MSKKASDSLHKLIHSLSKPEKRYFKVFASRHSTGENVYQILFDAILKQENYDELAILKKFKKESFTNRFAITKSRLYDTILKSLDAFHSNSSLDAQLKRNLHCVEILYKKSLYKESSKLLLQTKKRALKFEKHTVLIDIFKWEKQLIEKDNYTETNTKELEKIWDEDRLVLQKIRNFSDFWHIKSLLFQTLNKKGKARSQSEFNELKKIIDSYLLRSEDKALYSETQYLYHHIYSAYYFGVGDNENCYIHLQKNIQHIEKNYAQYSEEPNVYFSILSNAVYVASRLKKYDEALKNLDKIRSLPEKLSIQSNEDLDIKLFSSAYSIELTIYCITGQFEKGIELIPMVEEGLKLYGKKINNVRVAFLCFNSACLYVGAKNYSEALRWTNRLLNDVDIAQSEDIYCFAQILNLIIHLELKHNRLLPYALKSTSRYLETRNRKYAFEECILNFVKKAIHAEQPEKLKIFYHALSCELETLAQNDFEKTAFEYFDFPAWVEHKISGKDMREIVREKSGYIPV